MKTISGHFKIAFLGSLLATLFAALPLLSSYAISPNSSTSGAGINGSLTAGSTTGSTGGGTSGGDGSGKTFYATTVSAVLNDNTGDVTFSGSVNYSGSGTTTGYEWFEFFWGAGNPESTIEQRFDLPSGTQSYTETVNHCALAPNTTYDYFATAGQDGITYNHDTDPSGVIETFTTDSKGYTSSDCASFSGGGGTTNSITMKSMTASVNATTGDVALNGEIDAYTVSPYRAIAWFEFKSEPGVGGYIPPQDTDQQDLQVPLFKVDQSYSAIVNHCLLSPNTAYVFTAQGGIAGELPPALSGDPVLFTTGNIGDNASDCGSSSANSNGSSSGTSSTNGVTSGASGSSSGGSSMNGNAASGINGSTTNSGTNGTGTVGGINGATIGVGVTAGSSTNGGSNGSTGANVNGSTNGGTGATSVVTGGATVGAGIGCLNCLGVSLNGRLVSNEFQIIEGDTLYGFNYGTDQNNLSNSLEASLVSIGYDDQGDVIKDFNASIASLSPGTYYYQAKSWLAGQGPLGWSGQVLSFVIPGESNGGSSSSSSGSTGGGGGGNLDVFTSLYGVDEASGDVTLNGFIGGMVAGMINGVPQKNVKVWFDYGLTSAFGNTVIANFTDSQSGRFSATIPLSQLIAGNRYFWNAFAQQLDDSGNPIDAESTWGGSVVPFPAIQATTDGSIEANGLYKLTGTLITPTKFGVYFEIWNADDILADPNTDPSADFESSPYLATDMQSIWHGDDGNPHQVSGFLDKSVLLPNTKYWYRLMATANPDPPPFNRYGSFKSFTTGDGNGSTVQISTDDYQVLPATITFNGSLKNLPANASAKAAFAWSGYVFGSFQQTEDQPVPKSGTFSATVDAVPNVYYRATSYYVPSDSQAGVYLNGPIKEVYSGSNGGTSVSSSSGTNANNDGNGNSNSNAGSNNGSSGNASSQNSTSGGLNGLSSGGASNTNSNANTTGGGTGGSTGGSGSSVQVTTNDATNVSDRQATLNGSYSESSGLCSYIYPPMPSGYFVWGTDQNDLANVTPLQTLPSYSAGNFSQVLTGLSPSTKYYYLAVVIGCGTYNGVISDMKSFTTTGASHSGGTNGGGSCLAGWTYETKSNTCCPPSGYGVPCMPAQAGSG